MTRRLPTWLLYFLPTFIVGVVPWCAHLMADFIASGERSFENPLSVPEGYLFAYLLLASTVIEVALRDRFEEKVWWWECLRVIVLVLAVLLLSFSIPLYGAMIVPNHNPAIGNVQLPMVVVSGVLNLIYMTLKIARGSE